MQKRLFKIVERRPTADVPSWADYVHTKYAVQAGNADPAWQMSWYNVDIIQFDSNQFLNNPEDHHDESGEPCEDICICGPFSTEVQGLKQTVSIKCTSEHPVVFFSQPHPLYLERLTYCEEQGIEISTELVDVGDDWV
jgi:hypothetical protein